MTEPVSQSDRDFLRELQDLGACTIPQLCEAQGVTTTAVRQRLNRLQAGGYVSRESIRTQRGRPHHVYCLTVSGKKLLGDNYTELAMVLWHQLRELQDEPLKTQIVHQIEQSLVQRYGRNVDAVEPRLRLQQLQEALKEHGFRVEVSEGSERLALMERSCPYHDLASGDRSICDLEQQVFSQILGVELQLTQRCVDGHSCCRFEEVATQEEISLPCACQSELR